MQIDDTFRVRALTAKAEIQAYLDTDRGYAAYAIGDLDEDFFGQCAWYAAEQGGAIRALALVYRGLDPPVLFMMGAPGALAALLNGPIREQRVYITARHEHLPALGLCYHWAELLPMWRMVRRMVRTRPSVVPATRPEAIRLAPADEARLRTLYALGGGDAFSPLQLAQGVFYGIEQEGRLVSVAGTHLVSKTYRVAAVGNVMTHPDYRGRGYATRATAAVCAELERQQIGTIVLNVWQGNTPAVSVYEKLGFERYCPFYEGIVERR